MLKLVGIYVSPGHWWFFFRQVPVQICQVPSWDVKKNLKTYFSNGSRIYGPRHLIYVIFYIIGRRVLTIFTFPISFYYSSDSKFKYIHIYVGHTTITHQRVSWFSENDKKGNIDMTTGSWPELTVAFVHYITLFTLRTLFLPPKNSYI